MVVLNKLNDLNSKIGDIEGQMGLLKAFSGSSSSGGEGASGSGPNLQALMDAMN